MNLSRGNIKVKNLEKSVISKMASVEYKWIWASRPEEGGEIQYRESPNGFENLADCIENALEIYPTLELESHWNPFGPYLGIMEYNKVSGVLENRYLYLGHNCPGSATEEKPH